LATVSQLPEPPEGSDVAIGAPRHLDREVVDVILGRKYLVLYHPGAVINETYNRIVVPIPPRSAIVQGVYAVGGGANVAVLSRNKRPGPVVLFPAGVEDLRHSSELDLCAMRGDLQLTSQRNCAVPHLIWRSTLGKSCPSRSNAYLESGQCADIQCGPPYCG